MNYEKINKLNAELAELPSITDKLNHWKENYLDKYKDNLGEYFELKLKEEKGTDLSDGLSSELRLPIDGSELVPELHTPLHKAPLNDRINYYHWMLYYLAELRFERDIKQSLLRQDTTPLGKEKLTGRLSKIKAIQENGKDSLRKGLYTIHYIPEPNEEQLFLWYADDLYSRIEIPVRNTENTHVISVCEHHFVYPFLKGILKSAEKGNGNKSENLLKLVGIDIKRLVKELINKGYISETENTRLQNWFKGIKPKEPINIDKPMSHFASLIADLQEKGFIKNNKTFCKKLIHDTLLFDNEVKSIDSIKNALNENASTRIIKPDICNYIDIKYFKLKD